MESEDPNMEVEQEAFDEPPDSPTYSNGENGESQEDDDGGEDHPPTRSSAPGAQSAL